MVKEATVALIGKVAGEEAVGFGVCGVRAGGKERRSSPSISFLLLSCYVFSIYYYLFVN